LTVLDAILAVQSVVVIVVGVFLFMASKRVLSTMEKVEALLTSLEPKINDILGGIDQFLKTTQPVSKQIVDMSGDIKEIVASAKETSHRVADVVDETGLRARQQIAKVDTMVTETVEKAQTVTRALTENVMDPLLEVAAFLKGVRVAIRCFRRKPPPSAE
jgi:methyl-accepting chemotaxis protein